MCGIAGFIHYDPERKADQFVIKKMTDEVVYRGPDAEGYYISDNIAFGHRRLSIIDLSSGGDQPMFSEDRSIVLVFNGEIYNYIELREELKKLGHIFKTNSDTEVIIQSYLQWGVDCQNRFNGMWAFTLWDNNKQQLFVSRDRMGEKPVHYCEYDNSFIFGSEIKSILAFGVPRVPDTELIEIYMSLSFIPAPYTFYKKIKKLKAGCYLIVSGSQAKEYTYWDLPEIDEQRMLTDKKEIYKTFENLFQDSLNIRMRSDAPYGAFLSGGLDSSSIVALMSEISPYPVETFTIGFNEKAFDERTLARVVAQKFGTNHREFVVKPDSVEKALFKIIHHYDEPFGDSSAIPTGHVSEFAARNVKMVLTGDGGDEVLSGYTTYQGEKFSMHYQKLPEWIRKGIPAVIKQLSAPFKGTARYKLNRIYNVCNLANLNFEERYLSKTSSIDISVIKGLTQGQQMYPIEDFLSDFMKNCTYKDSFYKLMYLNLKLTLPDDMLVKVDRMSMAYSLETRTPFLDHRLVEYLCQVDKKVKMEGYERKSILKNTVGKKLPPALLNLSKKGFSVPLRHWFKERELNDLLNMNIFQNSELLKEVIELNKNGTNDYGNFIWSCLVLHKTMTTSGEYNTSINNELNKTL